MTGAQAMKRIPRIKFPQRRLKPSDSSTLSQGSTTDDAVKSFLSKSASGKSSLSAFGTASAQPTRTPVSTAEIEAILLGGCI